MIDERIVELLDRKYAFVAKSKSPDRFILEALRFLEWLFAEDLVRPYALQLLEEDSEHRQRFVEHRHRAVAEACILRDRIDVVYPSALKAEGEIEDHSPDYETSLTRFDRLRQKPLSVDPEEADLERSPQTDATRAGALVRLLRACEEALHGKDMTPEKEELRVAIARLNDLHQFRFNERRLHVLTSPARSLRNVLLTCRAQNPPPDRVDDWMSFFRQAASRDAAILKRMCETDKQEADRVAINARSDLERVYEELRAVLGTSLSSIALISRFKERCTWFDKDRMRAAALGQSEAKGVREDRLTLELARYLHDNGIFSLVRCRMANLEPDALAPFGPRRMAVESKVYDKGESARGAVRKGFWQFHSYLTSLETKAVRAHEGFLVMFRLGGSICDAPAVVALNRFRIHIVPIDLGESADSGHNQPKPSHVSVDELVEVAALPNPPNESDEG